MPYASNHDNFFPKKEPSFIYNEYLTIMALYIWFCGVKSIYTLVYIV